MSIIKEIMCLGGENRYCLALAFLSLFLAVTQVIDKAKVMFTYCALSFHSFSHPDARRVQGYSGISRAHPCHIREIGLHFTK